MWGLVVVLALLIPLIAVVLDSQLGRALAARLERDRLGDGGVLGERVAALEGEVDRLTRDVQRLEEEAEFLHRLLEHKPAQGD
ncbi:MAG: hypothetical protein GWO02_10780, partial [Gammaproteobacteria bacterium]|nr:hypothetical protein [Gammaproteobacteria bacterium]